MLKCSVLTLGGKRLPLAFVKGEQRWRLLAGQLVYSNVYAVLLLSLLLSYYKALIVARENKEKGLLL